MHILVDELPTAPNECIFNKTDPSSWKKVCTIDPSHELVCKIGSTDFKCPYIRKFKACKREQVTSNIVKIIPIELEED